MNKYISSNILACLKQSLWNIPRLTVSGSVNPRIRDDTYNLFVVCFGMGMLIVRCSWYTFVRLTERDRQEVISLFLPEGY